MKSNKVLVGVLAGVTAGALLGILFAPDKGSKTRKRIANKKEDYTESLKQKFYELVDMISKKVEGARDRTEELVTGAKVKYDEAKKEVKNAVV